ncbi:MAG: S8 family serine peptidase, partial [Oligoflexales bacterium]|nr:S8 family serine peptidase [Oligoflexales bacterium]
MNSKLKTMINKALNNYFIVFCFLPLLSISQSCDKKDDQEKKVYEPFRLVNVIPRFAVQPRIKEVGKDYFSLIFALDKSSKVAIYVLEAQDPKNQQIKSNLDVFNIGKIDKAKGRFFELELARHIRRELTFNGLTPDLEYKIYIASFDASIEDFFFNLSQKTLPDAKEVLFSGEPPLALQGVAWEFKPTLSEDVDGLILENAPKWLHWDALARKFKGVPEFTSKNRKEGALEEVVKIKVKVDQEGYTGEHEFILQISGDPLVEHAWHLENKGQRAFAWSPAKPNFDTFIAPVIAQGITGKGVEVHIIDSGLQDDHPDLKSNVNKAYNRNLSKAEGAIIAGVDNPRPPVFRGAEGDHGTSVAGIIAASGWNGIGSRGVAPNAKISATRIDFSNNEDDISSPSLIRSMDFENPKLIKPDIVNMSLGPRVSKLKQNLVLGAASAGFKIGENGELVFDDRDDLCYSDTRYYRATFKSAVSGRNKKGVVFVKAAGNGGNSPVLRNPD